MIRTLLIVGFLCFACELSAQTPVVITEANTKFNAPGDNATWRFIEPGTAELPARGENRVWDYSAAEPTPGGYEVVYTEADHPAFPTATVAYNAYYALNQFELTGQAFFEARATGEYYIGNAYNAETFNLGIGTLEVPEQTNHTEGATDLKLPATMGSSWQNETKLAINSLLTVSSAGLNNAPLNYLQTRTFNDSIIGWGTLKLPGGLTFNALLKKQIWIQVDSFFLNGQPAPAPLLTLLGVQQGSSTTREIYAFFTPGVSTEAMLFIVHQNGTEVSYRDDLSTTNVDDAVAGTRTARLYPNPVPGESAALEFEKTSNAGWNIAICNPLGEAVMTVPVKDPAGQIRMNLDMPSSIPNGFYYYEIRDEHGARKAGGPVVVGRE